jgi:hypothetical protein
VRGSVRVDTEEYMSQEDIEKNGAENNCVEK